MLIPPKKAGIKSKYNWSKLVKTGVQNILGDRNHSQVMRANARYFAKKNGLTITTRLHSRGIKIYLVPQQPGATGQVDMLNRGRK